ncbi:MAG: hypothetical protein PSX80_13730 [bacterium]|nr:hypothetical protein [bacterium]
MTTQTKLIVAAAGIIIVGLAIASLVSNHKLGTLEREIERSKRTADEKETLSHIAEVKAGEYAKKIEFLEGELTAIGQIARRQDEDLKTISGDVSHARRDVERARRIRAIDTTTDELCARLADLGHPC